MSYLVLARKWRPRRFAELVGQEHVVRALVNALDSGRVHHAFLFTGTRGVGKTTIARIFAKSLNCEAGTSADPCGRCDTCLSIDAGRFIDLLEIDAASNTGVDDVREVIDNAQYMPSRGRVKVYLIDEVHMLSKSAFNALLKTLEEPPGHVKFLLATTDPQKLPVTVLSRCLQFNLKRLDEAQIGGQIGKILAAEGIAAEAGAVAQLAKGADGSLRDGLSLLDQAIAYAGADGATPLTDAAVGTMLGSVDRARIGALLQALADGDGEALLAEVSTLAEFSPDWSSVLDAMASALHRVQVRQLVPGVAVEEPGIDLDALAPRLRPELVQLWYQMALDGRRDLSLAPSPQAGFEMSVLRMLAFRPADGAGQQAEASPAVSGARGAQSARAALEAGAPGRAAAAAAPPGVGAAAVTAPARVRPPSSAARPQEAGPRDASPAEADPLRGGLSRAASSSARDAATAVPLAPEAATAVPADVAAAGTRDVGPPAAPVALDADGWPDLVAGLSLRGPARELGLHAAFVAYADGVLQLSLPASDDHLKAPFLVDMLAQALAAPLGAAPRIRFEAAALAGETLHARTERKRDERRSAAESAFHADPHVQRLVAQGARVVPDSIRPYED